MRTAILLLLAGAGGSFAEVQRPAGQLSSPLHTLFVYYAYKLDFEAFGKAGPMAQACVSSRDTVCNFDEYLQRTITEANLHGKGKGEAYKSGVPGMDTMTPDEDTLRTAKSDAKFSGSLDPKKPIANWVPSGEAVIEMMVDSVQSSRRKLEDLERMDRSLADLSAVQLYLQKSQAAREFESRRSILTALEALYPVKETGIMLKTQPLTYDDYRGPVTDFALDINQTLENIKKAKGQYTAKKELVAKLESTINELYKDGSPVQEDKVPKDLKSARTHIAILQTVDESLRRMSGPSSC